MEPAIRWINSEVVDGMVLVELMGIFEILG